MNKRGPKPKKIIEERWNANLAYAIGLLVTDGCLANDGLLIDLTSKDKEQLNNFSKAVNFQFKIGSKLNGNKGTCFRIQFKNRFFYNFLLSVGLTSAKSKTLGEIKIPEQYFFDFVRGCFDGDGSFYSYWDKRWKSSHMFYLEFVSASEKFIYWFREGIKNQVNVKGHIVKDGKGSAFQLKYAKKEALVIIENMYYNPNVICLSRKKEKIEKVLKIEVIQQDKYKKAQVL